VAAAVAFGSRGFEAMKQHLTGKGVPYRVNQVPDSPVGSWSSGVRGERTMMRPPRRRASVRPEALQVRQGPMEN